MSNLSHAPGIQAEFDRLNRLRFAPAIEARFEAEVRARRLRSSRITVLAAIVIYDAAVFADSRILTDMAGWVAVLRFLVFTPVTLLALWLHPRTTTTGQSDLMIVGCTLVAILLPSAASVFSASPYVLIYMFGGMITMSYCTLVQRVRCRLAAVALVAAVAIQVWCLSRRPEIDAASFDFAVSFYISGASLLLMGSFILERTERHGFLEFLRAELLIAHIERSAHTDALTGVANRRHFETTFEHRWAEARRSGGALSLLVVDADHFKRYNDLHGHAVGDAVLQALARALATSARRPSDLVARIGGEEFAILLPDTDAEGAGRVAATVHEVVAGLAVETAGVDVGPVTVSIGLACGSARRMASRTDLFRLADAALYEAKVGGRNRTCRAPGRAEPAPPPTVQALTVSASGA